jgi:hypothetical protein
LPPDDEEPAWWRLVYTDNDAEDMYEEEVRDCIRTYQKKYEVSSHLQEVFEGIPICPSERIDGAEHESLGDVEEKTQAKPVKKTRTKKQIDASNFRAKDRTEKRKESKDIKVIEGIPICPSEGTDGAERESSEDVEKETRVKPAKKPRTQKQIDAWKNCCVGAKDRTEKRKESKDIKVIEGIPICPSERIDGAEHESSGDVEEKTQAKPAKKTRKTLAKAERKKKLYEKRKERKDIKAIKDEEDKKILDLTNDCESDEDSEDPHQLDSSNNKMVSHHEYHDAIVGEEEGQRNEKKDLKNENLSMIDDTLIGFLDGSRLIDEEDHRCEQDRLQVDVDSSVEDVNDMEVVTDPVYWSNIADSVDDSTNNSSCSNLNPVNPSELLQVLHPYLFQPSRWTVTRMNKFFFLRDALGFKIILESVQVHLFELDYVFNMIILLICTIRFRFLVVSS